MSKKEIIKVDKTHRILVDGTQGIDSIEPFIVFTPQRKGLLFWHNYRCIDYLPELDKIMIEQGGVL